MPPTRRKRMSQPTSCRAIAFPPLLGASAVATREAKDTESRYHVAIDEETMHGGQGRRSGGRADARSRGENKDHSLRKRLWRNRSCRCVCNSGRVRQTARRDIWPARRLQDRTDIQTHAANVRSQPSELRRSLCQAAVQERRNAVTVAAWPSWDRVRMLCAAWQRAWTARSSIC